jgi:hypothetical protein
MAPSYFAICQTTAKPQPNEEKGWGFAARITAANDAQSLVGRAGMDTMYFSFNNARN